MADLPTYDLGLTNQQVTDALNLHYTSTNYPISNESKLVFEEAYHVPSASRTLFRPRSIPFYNLLDFPDSDEFNDGYMVFVNEPAYDPDVEGGLHIYKASFEDIKEYIKEDIESEILQKLPHDELENITIAASSWRALSGKAPFNFSATVSIPTGLVEAAELINNDPVAFANYGFALASFDTFSAVFYAINKPSSSVTLSVSYREERVI